MHYGLFNAYFLAVIVVNAAAGANRAIVVNHLVCILFMVNTFIMFSFIDFEHRQFRLMAFASLAAMSAIAFSFSVNGVFYLGALGIARDTESLATYQGFARSYLMTFLPLVAYTRSLPMRLLLYAVGAATLFVNTARSEFAALLFAIPIIEFYFSRHKLIFLGLAVTIGMSIYLHLDDIIAALPESRILELVDLSHSTSANKRHHLTVYARQTIAAHPLLGDYASYAPGYYSHNVLSAWVDLGLFGFVYVLAITIVRRPAAAGIHPRFFPGLLHGPAADFIPLLHRHADRRNARRLFAIPVQEEIWQTSSTSHQPIPATTRGSSSSNAAAWRHAGMRSRWSWPTAWARSGPTVCASSTSAGRPAACTVCCVPRDECCAPRWRSTPTSISSTIPS
jgi:hypothetical protein